MPDFSKPTAVDDLTLAFPAGVMGLMPAYADIPDEFKRSRGQWQDWQGQWFFRGLQSYPEPKDGIDVKQAMRHLAAIQGSYEPKHEHKEAGVAYLASLWFKSPNGAPIAKKSATA